MMVTMTAGKCQTESHIFILFTSLLLDKRCGGDGGPVMCTRIGRFPTRDKREADSCTDKNGERVEVGETFSLNDCTTCT